MCYGPNQHIFEHTFTTQKMMTAPEKPMTSFTSNQKTRKAPLCTQLPQNRCVLQKMDTVHTSNHTQSQLCQVGGKCNLTAFVHLVRPLLCMFCTCVKGPEKVMFGTKTSESVISSKCFHVIASVILAYSETGTVEQSEQL